jgi:F-type H+-transporting ATPase subunit a
MILMDGGFGTHPTVTIGGCGNLCTFNYDSVISSLVAAILTLGVAFWLRSQLRDGAPSTPQAVFELGYDQIRGLIKDIVAEDAMFIVPLAMTLFMYILIANYAEILPLAFVPIIHGANADWNQTLAMALVVFAVIQWYGFKVLGWRGYLLRLTRPFELPIWARILFIPLNILEDVTKPLTLSLRLFGNIFAGTVMIALIAGFATLSLPVLGDFGGGLIGAVLLFIWKAFDVLFIGLLQAFIFMLLTIIYFGSAREGLAHIHHQEESR